MTLSQALSAATGVPASRAAGSITLASEFILVAEMNACHCGYLAI